MVNYRAGDVLEWQGCPVLVLGAAGPGYDDGAHRTVTYLDIIGGPFTVVVGQILPRFKIKDKEPWTKPLTDEQTILYTKMMLLYAS